MRSASYWMGSPALSVAVDAAKVEVVVIEESEHVFGGVGRRDGERGEAPCLPKALYEPGAVGGPLDPYHRPILAAAYGGP